MEEKELRALVVQTGRELLRYGLVARTWGNVSTRLSESEMLITPSGLDYHQTTEDDIVKVNLKTGEWSGRKPSGERGVHIAAYECFPEDGFVIHTHQDAASAISLTGLDNFEISEEECAALGGIEVAEYGLPGTKKLTESVRACFQKGAHTVLMQKHGVVISAKNKEEAMERAQRLEVICKRNLKCAVTEILPQDDATILSQIESVYHDTAVMTTPSILTCALTKEGIRAQLDDMAQMIGGRVKVAKDKTQAIAMLRNHPAVLIPHIGAVLRSEDSDDRDALMLLVDKAALCTLHTKGCQKKSRISAFDTALMHTVYRLKYSKQKDKKV